jgi:hypothetical protein
MIEYYFWLERHYYWDVAQWNKRLFYSVKYRLFIHLEISVLSLIDIYVIKQISNVMGARVAQWVRSLDLTAHTSLSPMRRGFAPGFVNYKKCALESQPQVIKFISCLPMVDGSLRVLRLLPPLQLVAMI